MLKEKILEDIKKAMRAKEELRLSTLRMLSAAMHNRAIEKRARSGESELSDEEALATIRSEVKKRRDAAGEFERGDRLELAEKERAESKILEAYLPSELNDEEIEEMVRETVASLGEVTAKDFGRVMGETMKRVKGRASGDRVSATLRKYLK